MQSITRFQNSLVNSAASLMATIVVAFPAVAFTQTVAGKINSWAAAQAEVLAWHALQPKSQASPSKPVLRVVYFHGDDMKPLPDYASRLTRVMQDVSDFYRDGLAAYGIENKGLALEYNPDGNLRLHVVKGKHLAAHYDYSSGDETELEISKALESEYKIEQSFVLVLYGQCWKLTDGRWGFYAPYYGKGGSNQAWGFCHAADCELLDPKLLTDTKNRLVYWEHYGDRDQSVAEFNSFYLGGIAHELGHGLGLPHDHESVLQKLERGSSLMGIGNLTYREEKWKPKSKGSFLSETSAVRLLSHPIITASNAGRFDAAEVAVTKLEGVATKGKLTLSGTLECPIPPYAVVAYVNPPRGTDHRARSYTAPVKQGKFSLPDISTPDAGVRFRLVVCLANGATSELAASLPVENGLVQADKLCQQLRQSFVAELEREVATNHPKVRQHLETALHKSGLTPDTSAALHCLLNYLDPVQLQKLATIKEPSCYLSDVEWESAESGWAGTPRNKWGADPSYGQGLLLRIAGKLYDKGLPAHCSAKHVFDLDGQWKSFQATVGIRDGAASSARGIFIVKLDGKELHRTKPLAPNEAVEIKLETIGGKKLELLTESGNTSTSNCWAVWGSPKVER